MIEIITNKLLPVAALILSVINGLVLLYNFLRDKPRLVISPVHPETYQRWVRLTDTQRDGHNIRRYVFLSYFSVANAGLRDVSVISWRLNIKNKLRLWKRWHKKMELKPCNLPEPQCLIGNHIKCIKAFGQNTQNFHESSNMVKAGDSTSGMACWVYSVWGGEGWSPQTNKNNDITANLIVGSVLGDRAECKLVFHESSLDRLKEMMPTIGEYLENSEDFLL